MNVHTPRAVERVRGDPRPRDGQDRARYRLLDSTRHFALDKLAEAGEDIATRDRHAAYIRDLFADSVLRWEVLPDERWDQIYRPDGDKAKERVEMKVTIREPAQAP